MVRLTQLARSKLAQHLYPDDFSHIVRALAETGQVSESLRLLRFAVEQQPENVRDEELKTQLLTVLTAALGRKLYLIDTREHSNDLARSQCLW